MMLSRVAVIQNKKGLHARAAAKFVKCVEAHKAQVTVTRLGEPPADLEEDVQWTVGGNSILGLMMLAAEPGTELELKADGKDAIAVLDALEALMKAKFGEGE